MVCEWGMSEKLGPLSFGKKDEEIFLGREIAKHQDYSNMTAELIDTEITGIVIRASAKAREIVEEHIDKLHALAKALLDREILDGAEIDRVLKGEKLEPLKNESVQKDSRNSKSKDEELVDSLK
jgi:cell division protease FtsH